MKKAAIYVHGKGGSAAESEHYVPLFPDCEVIGFDYKSATPQDAEEEFCRYFKNLKSEYESITLIANSIGTYYCMIAGIGDLIQKAYFISPIVDMQNLIRDIMRLENVTEQELESKGVIHTGFGEDLSWNYLCFAREHPLKWDVPTEILYGKNDDLTSFGTIRGFASANKAHLTVMENGEHWFHTKEQMLFLDKWIKERRGKNENT